jgi:SsrA-binding protein
MAKDKEKQPGAQVHIDNKKAWHEYHIIEKIEAGVALCGTEVKSLRGKFASLDGAYARIREGECWLIGANIAQYSKAAYGNHDPLRERKLLLHRRQIEKLLSRLKQRGMTLVPLKMYFNDRGYAKVELGVAGGKHQHDKRAVLKERDAKKELAKSNRRR